MKSERLDITDDKKPITTDHNGFPLMVENPDVKKLPAILRASTRFSSGAVETESSGLRTDRSSL